MVHLLCDDEEELLQIEPLSPPGEYSMGPAKSIWSLPPLCPMPGGCFIQEAFFNAVVQNNIRVVEALLRPSSIEIFIKLDPGAHDNEAIKWAAENGMARMTALLQSHKRVDPSAGNNYAFRFAAAQGFSEVMHILIQDSRVDPTADNYYALRATKQIELRWQETISSR